MGCPLFPMPSRTGKFLSDLQEYRFNHPERDVHKDFRDIYKKNHIAVGWPKKYSKIFAHLARPNTGSITGAALGDEGKGRIIDNKIGALLSKPRTKCVVVIRFQGGNNSGHTIQVKNTTMALHQIPCGIMYKKTICIIDRGMAVNPVDLVDEIQLVERIVGSVRKKLFLSRDAILNTDLDRAEELVNRKKQGNASGGTGRGVAPSYAHHYDRLGFHISDYMGGDWEVKIGVQYDRYAKEFMLYGVKLKDIEVPDFAKTKRMKKEQKRKIGTRKEFLHRLAAARKILLGRQMIKNTYVMHQKMYQDTSQAVLFEGAQSLGLHPWLGTIPDITASDTSVYGIQTGTAFWKATDIEERIGVFKVPYTSSVGVRRMPTHAEDDWSKRVREEAHEYGTTTGRPRDILYPDIPLLAYNCRMSGVEMLAGTHLDVAWASMPIKVCTHYTDKKGNMIPYQPGLVYLKDVVPHFIELPGWDGIAVRRAKSFRGLPDNAKKFLAFIQARLAVPIVAVTTGPGRENYLEIPSYS